MATTRNRKQRTAQALALAGAKGLKVVTTLQLGRLNAISVAHGYNRSISDEGITALDPAGMHVLKVAIIHQHAAGVPVEPHYRLLVLMKLVGSDEPAPVTLDVPIDVWDDLPPETSLKDMRPARAGGKGRRPAQARAKG